MILLVASSVSLGIIRRGVTHLKAILLGKVHHSFSCKHGALVDSDGLGDPKTVYDLVLEEPNHCYSIDITHMLPPI